MTVGRGCLLGLLFSLWVSAAEPHTDNTHPNPVCFDSQLLGAVCRLRRSSSSWKRFPFIVKTHTNTQDTQKCLRAAMVETREKEIWSLSDFLLPPLFLQSICRVFICRLNAIPKRSKTKTQSYKEEIRKGIHVRHVKWRLVGGTTAQDRRRLFG
jgi:hypothetical protein